MFNQRCLVNTRKFMAELEPYSFEPMRESSGSEEEEATEREDSRWGNTTWCSCDFCLNWEAGTARKGMHLLPRDRGAMNKSQVN